ncbi:hypothetical protein C8Q76DRAFT_707320 [Earliella scabrosa]|nr:hypothetical protein C8Q76DRAFT_707320 [Earliella scabrosa]
MRVCRSLHSSLSSSCILSSHTRMPRASILNVARRRVISATANQPAALSTSHAPRATLGDAPAPLSAGVSHSKSRTDTAERDERRDIASAMRGAKTSIGVLTRPNALRTPYWQSASPMAKDAPHIRAFHTSPAARRPNQDDSSSFERRRQDIPTSAWSRPPRPSQDSDDNVVPTYYVERKKQRDSISQRKEEEGGLMAELNAGILSEGLAAETRVRDEKMPVEVRLPDGTISHPSGFEPPTPETDFHPVAAKVPTEEHPLVATVKQPWDERDFVEAGAEPISICPDTEAEWIQRKISNGNGGEVITGVRDISVERPVGTSQSSTSPSDRSKITTSAWDTPSRSTAPDDPDNIVPSFYIERKRQRDSISERKEEEGGLMAELNAGILSDELAAQTREREEKIPVEIALDDGTVLHPSGFVPPTAETEFHPVAAKPGDAAKQPWVEVLGKKPSESRGLHTSAVDVGRRFW